MWVSINIEVMMRYVFNQPTSWATDFTLYLVFYVTLLAAPLVLAQDGHVKLELLTNHLSPAANKRLLKITSYAGSLVCFVMFWYSLKLTWLSFQKNELFVQAVIMPRWVIYVVMPIGFLLLAMQFIRRAHSGLVAPSENVL